MKYEFITLEVDDGVGVISLNRPESGNAMTLEMLQELLNASLYCDESPEVRAVVLTAKGKAFSVGGDLQVFAAQGERVSAYIKELTCVLHAAISRLNWMDAPVVTAINGTAAGGGFSLALGTDIAIAAESARLTMAYTKAGLSPDGSSTYFLSRLVGMRRAKEMALLNPVLTAQQALEWGIVNQVAADDRVLAVALEMARKWAKGPTRAYGETKRLVLSGATESLETQMEKELRTIAAMFASPDGREGVKAFLEKRPPRFEGK